MRKTFDDIKVEDKVYVMSIRDSKLYEYPKGCAFRELKATSVIRYPSNVYVSLSDGITTINAKKCLGYHSVDRDDDEISLSADVYAVTKREAAEAVVRLINGRRTAIRAIKRKCEDTENELDITRENLNDLDLREEELEPSLEEFASMSLED